MTDLSKSVWHEIIESSAYLPQDGPKCVGRHISLAKLQNILRKSRRSNDQNSLLWALYADALEQGGETLGGWTAADLHEWLLGTHFGWERYDALGMVRQRPKRRSSRLTKMEFSALVETLVRELAEHGIVLELPGEQAIGRSHAA